MVCEASSFQLEDTDAFAPECGVLLNIAPDHLDRHADLERYLEAKLRIFANQGDDDVCVFNGSDPARGVELGGAVAGSPLPRPAAPPRVRPSRAGLGLAASR